MSTSVETVGVGCSVVWEILLLDPVIPGGTCFSDDLHTLLIACATL